MNKAVFVLPLLALGAGCSLAPRYERPESPVAAGYPSATAAPVVSGTIPEVNWQGFFGDERLKRIIALALENNRDARVAALNVQRVRSFYNIQRTALIPQLNAAADGSRQRTPGDLNASGRPITSSSYSVGLEIPSYELDFFGRVASLRDQVLQQYLATQEAQTALRISLISSVASQYLALQAADEQLALAQQTFEAAERSLGLTRQTFEAGINSALDVRTAETQRASIRASLAALAQRRASLENGLVLLVGAPLPADLPAPSRLASQPILSDIPPGIPADLLARRPDVRAAEHVLEAANANIGVARAAFFPSITLTAFGGTASSQLEGLFEKGSGRWIFSPSVTLPIFAAGRNRAQLNVAKIEKEIEIANYEQTIQRAFREVADALAIKQFIETEISAQEERVAAARGRYDLTQQRFDAGVEGFLTVLLAQQELFGAEQALIEARLERLTNLIALYAALGGWPDAKVANAQ